MSIQEIPEEEEETVLSESSSNPQRRQSPLTPSVGEEVEELISKVFEPEKTSESPIVASMNGHGSMTMEATPLLLSEEFEEEQTISDMESNFNTIVENGISLGAVPSVSSMSEYRPLNDEPKEDQTPSPEKEKKIIKENLIIKTPQVQQEQESKSVTADSNKVNQKQLEMLWRKQEIQKRLQAEEEKKQKAMMQEMQNRARIEEEQKQKAMQQARYMNQNPYQPSDVYLNYSANGGRDYGYRQYAPAASEMSSASRRTNRRPRNRSGYRSRSREASVSTYHGANAPPILSSRISSDSREYMTSSPETYYDASGAEQSEMENLTSASTMGKQQHHRQKRATSVKHSGTVNDDFSMTIGSRGSIKYILENNPKSQGLFGIKESLSEWDAMCPYCLTKDDENTEQVSRHLNCLCCSRITHLGCLLQNPCELALALRPISSCISCMRPKETCHHEIILKTYEDRIGDRPDDASGVHENYYSDGSSTDESSSESSSSSATIAVPRKKKGGGNSDAENNPMRSAVRQQLRSGYKNIRYSALETVMKANGIKKSIQKMFVSSVGIIPSQTPRVLDRRLASTQGITMRMLMMEAGWSLAEVVEEFHITKSSDEIWQKLKFDRNTLLDMPLKDMLYFMKEFDFHPYQLRKIFEIHFRDLFESSMRRRDSPNATSVEGSLASSPPKDLGPTLFQDHAYENSFRQTANLCHHHRVLSPDQLAVLGFNFHHLIVMGLSSKDDLLRFTHFSLADWVDKLGFKPPHWEILGFHKEDFSEGSALASLRGWDLIELLSNHWKVNPTERMSMGCLGQDEMDRSLREGLNRTAPVIPVKTEPITTTVKSISESPVVHGPAADTIIRHQPQYRQQAQYGPPPPRQRMMPHQQQWQGHPHQLNRGGQMNYPMQHSSRYQPNPQQPIQLTEAQRYYQQKNRSRSRPPRKQRSGSSRNRRRRHVAASNRNQSRQGAAPQRPMPPPAQSNSVLNITASKRT